MSDECGYVPDWWKAPKAASLERKKRAAQTGATSKPGDTFLIVTEGTVTEPVYFELLLQNLQLYAVQVMVVPGRASDPRHVIATAVAKVKDHQRRCKKGLLSSGRGHARPSEPLDRS